MNAPTDRTRRLATGMVGIAVAALLVAAVGGCGLSSVADRGAGTSTSTGVSDGSRGSAGAVAQGAAQSASTEQLAPSADAAKTGTAASTVQRMVVRDGTLRLKVKDVAETAKKVGLMTQAAGGYVESMQLASDPGGTVPMPQPVYGGDAVQPDVSSGSTPLSGYVRVRVPTAKLAAFSRDVSALGEVIYQATDAQDVTAQHVDMVARLKNLQAAEADLRRLSARARTVGEVLAVQRELTRVQGEIESLQAQIALLEDQAAMAAVTVQLAGPEAIVSPGGDSWGFTEAVRTAVRAFVGTINVLIIALGALLPIFIIIGLVGLLIWWLVHRGSARRRAAREAAQEQADAADAPGVADEPVVPSEPETLATDDEVPPTE